MTSRVGQPDTSADQELAALLDAQRLKNFTMIAGAGSGKTTSLVKALAHIVTSRGSELRQRTQRVACVTYTEVAAGEIAADVGNSPLVRVSTIHSFLWSVVRPFQRDIAVWTDAEVRRKLKVLENEQAEFSARVGDAKRAKTANDIEKLRTQLVEIPKVPLFTYGVGSDYGRGVLGHEDILWLGSYLISARPLLAKLIARQYPFIFVDESQDTFEEVVVALKHVASLAGDSFCLGFFGDPMQQIFMRGVRNISVEGDDWQVIEKPENFRSPRQVLALTNQIRSADDGLSQVSGLPEAQLTEGDVTFFVLPGDDDRTRNLDRVREWLDDWSVFGAWTDDDPQAGAKVLVIEHRMAARRLGFGDLFAAFTDNKSGSLEEAFKEGTAWPVKPFLEVLLPLAHATPAGAVSILRQRSPALQDEVLRTSDVAQVLAEMRTSSARLKLEIEAGGPGSIGRILDIAIDGNLLEVDPRLLAARHPSEVSTVVLSETTRVTLEAFLSCDVKQLAGYEKYIADQSPYSTHQGVKGTEFPRVLVVLDDHESNYKSFSYEKLLGLRPLSKADLANRQAGKQTVVDRTRRLFYVCCSRATQSLAVVLFCEDVDAAVASLQSSGLPGADSPVTLRDLDQRK